MIDQDIEKLSELREVGIALVKYASSLFPNTRFEANAQGRYVAQPDNLVTFKVHWQRAKNITVTLRGNPDEFLAFDELKLRPDMAGYSSFKVSEVGQLAAAAFCIRRSAEIYKAGRERIQKGIKVVED